MIECAFSGRLGKDPILDRVKGGELARLVFDACVTGKSEDPDQPRWIRVTVLGDNAETLVLEKGCRVYVEGRLSWAVWQPPDQPARASIRMLATLVQPIGLIGRRRPPQPRQTPALPPLKPGHHLAWSQPLEETPFHDDWQAAVKDLQGRP